MGQPNTGQPAGAFDVDAWARDRARAKLGRVLLRQSQRKADARPPAATPPPLPLTATIPPPEAETLDPVPAARRLQHVARRRIATRRRVEEAMRAFARDYEARPPPMGEAAARRRFRSAAANVHRRRRLDGPLAPVPRLAAVVARRAVARHDPVAGVLDAAAGLQPHPRET